MTKEVRIAVVSDIHSNARAFEAALTALRSSGFDQLVVLGDLLTYGVEPEEVLEIAVREAAAGAVFIKGNHDQIYFDLARGRQDYLRSLPEWLRETVCWTQARIGSTGIDARIFWRDEWVQGPVLFAHANPFAFADWTYLNDDADFLRAGIVLRERGAKLGVFGHTHRPKVVLVQESPAALTVIERVLGSSTTVELPKLGVAIFDIGSVGQPRNSQKLSSAGIVTLAGDRISCEWLSLDYDVRAHRQALSGSSMSEGTVQKLLGFFQ